MANGRGASEKGLSVFPHESLESPFILENPCEQGEGSLSRQVVDGTAEPFHVREKLGIGRRLVECRPQYAETFGIYAGGGE